MTYSGTLKKLVLISLTCITFNLGFIQAAAAEEDSSVSPATTESPKETEVEKNLGKNDETRISRLAELSGKSKEEISKMRTQQKMGWGAIAKALGVSPSQLGQATRDDRKEKNAQRKQEKNERKEKKLEERSERKEEKADRKEQKK